MLGLDKDDLKKLCKKKGHEYMEKYMKNVEELNEDSEFVNVISQEKDNEMVINTLKNEAIREGKEEGIKEGIKEGIVETAKALLKEKISIDIISRTTRLKKEEIEKLRETA